MFTSKKILQSMLGLAFCAIGLQASPPPKTMVIFGDSDSDQGNVFVNFPPGPTFFWPNAPYSDRATSFAVLANMWGTNADPVRAGGLNYSVAAAATNLIGVDLDPPITPIASYYFTLLGSHVPTGTGTAYVASVEQQVDKFLSTRQDVEKDAIVFHLSGGGNQVRYTPTNPLGAAVIAAEGNATNMKKLQDHGYKYLVCYETAVFSGATIPVERQIFRENLPPALKAQGVNAFIVDLSDLFQAIYDDPTFWGFSAPADPTNTMATTMGPDGTFYWFDGIHISDLGQIYRAQYFYNFLEAPEAYGRLAQQTFGVMRGHNATLRQQLYPITTLCECEFYPFISGSYLPLDEAAYPAGPGKNSDGWDILVGLAYRFSHCWTAGLAASYEYNKIQEKHEIGTTGFHLGAWTASALAGYQSDTMYVNGFFTFAYNDFCKVYRDFYVGPQTFNAKGSTHGLQYDLLVESGWLPFVCCDFQLGPFVTLEYQYNNVDGFKEKKASYNNVEYGDQHAQSFVTGLGLQFVICGEQPRPTGDCCCPCTIDCKECGFSATGFLSINEDWLRSTRDIRYRALNVPDAPYGLFPVKQKRVFFGSAGINFNYAFGCGLIGNLGYRASYGQYNLSEQSITLNLTMPICGTKKCSKPCIENN